MTGEITAPPTATPPRGRFPRALGTVVLAVALSAGLAVLLLVLAGVFKAKVPGEKPGRPEAAPGDQPVAEVHLVRRPRSETAVGTVRAVHEAAVASKILARVTEVSVKAGQPVIRDQVLVRLDDSDLQARLKQAEAADTSARAAKSKADSDLERIRPLVGRAVSREDFDRALAAQKTAEADVNRAQQAVREARVLLDFATIRAPITGVIIDKRIEAGETAAPGQVLLKLFDPTRMQMIVTVRESLARRLTVGQKVRGRLEALEHECEATVSEIVPEAEAASRSFQVKVTGPCPPGVYSGMFGRIFIPLDDEEVVVVPAAAVRRVGQLDIVAVVEDGTVCRRIVQLGRKLDEEYEVLSGLKPGEKIVLQARSSAREAQP